MWRAYLKAPEIKYNPVTFAVEREIVQKAVDTWNILFAEWGLETDPNKPDSCYYFIREVKESK